MWDLETGTSLLTFDGHADSIRHVAITLDERRAVSASRDDTLRVWDLETGTTLHTLEGHTESVTLVASTQDGRRAVSASYDHTLRVWDLETDSTIATTVTDQIPITTATSNHVVVAGGNDGAMNFYRLEE